MERLSNKAQLLKEDSHLVKKVMRATRNKFDLCLRRDGAHVEGIGRHKAIKNGHFITFLLQLFFCVNFKKDRKQIVKNKYFFYYLLMSSKNVAAYF